jgi:predicted nucleotidyltransferase
MAAYLSIGLTNLPPFVNDRAEHAIQNAGVRHNLGVTVQSPLVKLEHRILERRLAVLFGDIFVQRILPEA